MATGRVCPSPLYGSPTYGGAYRIRVTVARYGALGRYRVRLIHRRSGLCLREKWTDATDGTATFDGLAYEYQGYVVEAFDHGTEPLNACIYDFVTPEPMP